MRNRKLVRFQLLVLAILAGLIVARVLVGPGDPVGLVVISDVGPGELRHEAFALERTEPLIVEASGSLEESYRPDQPLPPLAAYGWILRREDRSVVWKMEGSRSEPSSGTLVRTESSLTLEPGTYDVYFTSYGNDVDALEAGGFLGQLLRHHWTKDAEEWKLVLRSGTDEAPLTFSRVDNGDVSKLAPSGPDVLWSATALPGYEDRQFLFSTLLPQTIRVYAVGEVCADPCDFGWIEDVFSGRRVWELNGTAAEPAGGFPANHVFRGDAALEPGIYRAVFKTDPGHAYGEWMANPPYDPAAWGMTLFADPKSSGPGITRFDPWEMEPAVRIARVEDGADESVRFDVVRDTRVILYGVGEIHKNGKLYDFGSLRDERSGETVWEMSAEHSFPAGGHKGNRAEVVFLRLPEGAYSLNYESDGSHSFGSFINGTPDHPERWGLAMFVMGADSDVRVIGPVTGSARSAPEDSPAPPTLTAPIEPSKILADLRQVGNEQLAEESFGITEPTLVRIVATGEISRSDRYDYAWIERADTGESIWEMNWAGTSPAGGDDRNRRFDGALELMPGNYVVRFRTDFSHAFGDFGVGAPADPASWGVVVAVQ
jgi:hypothetical protein